MIVFFWIVDVVGLYPNIAHVKCLSALHKGPDLEQERDTTSTLVEFTKVVLKNNIFSFKGKDFKSKVGYSYWYKICSTV